MHFHVLVSSVIAKLTGSIRLKSIQIIPIQWKGISHVKNQFHREIMDRFILLNSKWNISSKRYCCNIKKPIQTFSIAQLLFIIFLFIHKVKQTYKENLMHFSHSKSITDIKNLQYQHRFSLVFKRIYGSIKHI